jgi:putative tryptophan/tyrosine transport system substrate-binding protein
MHRRDFLPLLGGAAAWPIAARGQQPNSVRRMGWLIDRNEDDAQVQFARATLREALAKLGWNEGGNLRIEARYGARDVNRIRDAAAELVAIAPELILTNGLVATREFKQRTRTIPIIFTAGPEPVEAGLLQSIARPEGNITGFTTAEPSIGNKWAELLKEAVPRLTRIAAIENPFTIDNVIRPNVQEPTRVFGMQLFNVRVRSSLEAVRAIDAFAAQPDGGLIVLPPPPSIAIRDTLFDLANQHRLPAIYGYREQVVAGGLMSYGSKNTERYVSIAAYVDRVLRGAKISDLPVQFPIKYELVINLKAAKAIGLTIPEVFLLRADELIE